MLWTDKTTTTRHYSYWMTRTLTDLSSRTQVPNIKVNSSTGKSVDERYKENIRAPSPIFNLFQTTGHDITLDNVSLVDRKPNGITRTIKEAMFIRVNDPPLNRNLGKYQLSHIWDEVLQDILALQLQ